MRAAIVVVSLTCALPRPAAADTRDLQRVSDEVAQVGVELKSLVEQYRDPDVVAPARRFSQRVTDGEILFLLGDYDRSSLVLYDLINDRRNASNPLYEKAIYYLAESLYQIGHDTSAREHFQELVRRRNPRHLRASIRRLIQIADRNRRWEGLQEHVAVLREQGGLPPGIAYINAKSLLRQGQPQKALDVARTIPKNSNLGAKAAYLVGVAMLLQGNLDGARDAFTELMTAGDQQDDAGRIRELAAMNRGRILQEQGRHVEAVDAYQHIGRRSSLFEDALYEVTWTYVRAADEAKEDVARAAEFRKAEKALEILLLSEAETPLAPEARLLLGNIQIRLRHYEVATETFDSVVERYGPVRDVLHETAARDIDPERFFEEVSGDSSGRTGVLPPLAVKWATDQQELSEAMSVVRDLDASEVSLREADEIVEKLLGVLDSERRASFFPTLQDAQGRALQLGNTLVALSQRLLVVERELVSEKLDDVQAQELQRVLAERAELEPEYRKLPQQQRDYEGRMAGMRRRMEEMQQQAFRLKYTVNSIRAQLSALQIWISQNRDYIDETAGREYRERIGQEAKVVEELESLQVKLEREIEREKSMISITSKEEARETEVRTRYQASLEREREILATASGLDGDGRTMVERLTGERERIASYRVELQAFGKRLDDAVGAKSQDLKAEVLKERGVLESYYQSINATRGDARRVVGEIARDSFNDVRARFQNIVLRADVGIVDVAWTLKEEQTHEISRRVNEQRRELRVLDADYAEVLKED